MSKHWYYFKKLDKYVEVDGSSTVGDGQIWIIS